MKNMFFTAFIGSIVGLLLGCFSSVGPEGSRPAHKVNMAPEWPINQGWNPSERWDFYFTSQGSELIPYDWFLNLEYVDSGNLFRTQLVERYGFIDAGTVPGRNPDGLPVGFVLHKDPDTYSIDVHKWMGLTCAACHTGSFQYKNKEFIVDGAPSHADFNKFIIDLQAALEKTAVEPKFTPFANRVIALNPGLEREILRRQLTRFIQDQAKFLKSIRTDVPWGPGRVDAFGVIFNRIAEAVIKNPSGTEPENSKPPNAPVSYPFLWNIHRQTKIQWHGELKNILPIERLGRNVGEVLGVFAQFDLDPGPNRYRSSIDIEGLKKLEKLAGSLKAPKWPEQIFAGFGPDPFKVAQGEKIYKAQCERCHKQIPAAGWATIKPVSIDEVRTDDLMAKNFHTRRVSTGKLEGAPKYVYVKFPKFTDEDFARKLVVNAVIGAIGRKGGVDPTKKESRANSLSASVNEIVSSLKQEDNPKWGYEARPLNGIWATPPYLHNGSVPTLADLLSEPAQRPNKFKIGNSYDPKKVGLATDGPGDEFDTSREGNSNAGHWERNSTDPESGIYDHLTNDQRAQLLEYLKSL